MRNLNNWSKEFPLDNCDNFIGIDMDILSLIKNTRHLTEALEAKFKNHNFRMLKQGFSLDIKNISDIKNTSDIKNISDIKNYNYIRESGHFINDRLAVYAQVITNKDVYQAYKNKLQNLNNNPIGPTWLFRDNSIARSDFLYKLLSPSNNLYKSAVKWGMKSPVIARESDFIKQDNGRVLLNLKIIEVFDKF